MENFPEIKKRFDAVAVNYDKKIEIAKCFGPEQMLRVFKDFSASNSSASKLEILDLGCGTGLCAQTFKPYIGQMDGVDLSENMLAKARELGLYRDLYLNDIVSHLTNTDRKYDMLTSGGVLMYFQDVQPFLDRSFHVLKKSGILTFSCDRHDDGDLDVQISPRNNLMYTFSEEYLERCIKSAGFRLVKLEKITERLAWKNQDAVPGFVALATKQ